jgi:hypothetical protein
MAKANKAAKKSAAAKAAPVPSPQVAAEELKDQRVKQAAADEKAVKAAGPVSAQVPVQVILPDLKEEGYDTSKKFISRHDKQAYHLKVDENDPRGRTHKLKNLTHFWEGDEEAFKDHFDKD